MDAALVTATWLFLVSLGSAAAGTTSVPDPNAVRLMLGGVEWYIPQVNVQEDIPWYIRAIPGLRDDSNQVMITFPVASFRRALPNLAERESYNGVLTALQSKDDLARVLHFETKRAEEIWRGEGRFNGALIEPAKPLGLVRVYDKYAARSRATWELVTSEPLHDNLPPAPFSAYWVGSCQRMGPQSNRSSSCLTRIVVGQAYIDIHIPEADLQWHRQISALVSKEVTSWRRAAN